MAEQKQAVSVVPCRTYQPEEVSCALEQLLAPIGGLDWVAPGMKIAIKVNLVSMMKPECAATTHPVVVEALCKLLTDRGARVIIGDSPGGLFTVGHLESVYRGCGMNGIVREGVALNHNVATVTGEFPQGKSLRTFEYTAWLKDADAIINVCKLKTHAMMGMSAAVKNMFGAIPGVLKPEYHYRFPVTMDFANMLVDLNEYFPPSLCIVDGVVGMEGNGPTQGTPRDIGVLLASKSPYPLDLVCAKLIGLTKESVPTLQAAWERGLSPAFAEEVMVCGELMPYVLSDFKNIDHLDKIESFAGKLTGINSKLFNKIASAALCSRPRVKKEKCVGCAECFRICPAKAITMKNKLPVINREQCIHCFCCQEFCPKGAMICHRPLPARIINRKK